MCLSVGAFILINQSGKSIRVEKSFQNHYVTEMIFLGNVLRYIPQYVSLFAQVFVHNHTLSHLKAPTGYYWEIHTEKKRNFLGNAKQSIHVYRFSFIFVYYVLSRLGILLKPGNSYFGR